MKCYKIAERMEQVNIDDFKNCPFQFVLVLSPEEWNLKKKRYRFLEQIRCSVVVLLIPCLKDHYALVAFECRFDALDPRRHLVLLKPLFLLNLVGSRIQRQQKKVYCKTHDNYGYSGASCCFVCVEEQHFEKKFEWFDKQSKHIR